MNRNNSNNNEIEDGVQIPITREEVDSPPFPHVDKNASLSRTSQLDLSKRPARPDTDQPAVVGNMSAAAVDEDVNELPNVVTPSSSRKNIWNTVNTTVKSTPKMVGDFLGFESKPSSSQQKSPMLKSVGGADETDQSATTAAANNSYIRNKTLTNWDERTFKVLNKNPIFGGKVKESKIKKYLDNVDETNVDMTDPCLYYKLNGSALDTSKHKITIKTIANDSIGKVFKVSK
jgi:hypothetical protein